MADSARHMALEPQPDERLDELVGTEQHGIQASAMNSRR
jgi:hypothetical protein